ncbi:GTPase [Rhodococcus sp. NPDC058532]|uniref:GTPase n=1 Tax=Rhodococcus sp. NPDC058532 TaxID=3346540 RepID=UPI00364F7AD4
MTLDVVSLEDAAHTAVEQGRAELSRLDDVVDGLVSAFAGVAACPHPMSPLVAKLDDLARGLPRDLRRHLDRERDSLGSFNIAFFGRTGVGKSTLLSAFGQLDGEYVSPGASDWTTDVHHVEWRGCRLYDTPGINGWGRTESRDDLESKARRAVEIADVVLLCFDNQSQQALEFEKIAAWIRDHGKPVVAVLNVRNPRWRHPAKVSDEGRRKTLSESVRQHTDNIRTELAQIGLPDTPVVAIHSRRALFARATTPFHGPAEKEFLRERDEFGVDYLARWSNFGTLEQLIAASITEGGADLRLSALREDVRGRCARTVIELERLTVDIAREAKELERQIESLFAVLGYPEREERARWLHESDRDLVATSEAARGRPYTSRAEGSLDRYVRDIATSHLVVCRSKAKTAADELIQSAFDEGKSVDGSDFTKAVFDDDAVATAEQTIWADRGKFLQRELEIAVEHNHTHSSGPIGHTASILGAEGTGVLGKVIQGGGIAAGLGVLAVPALMNFWNPAGWAIGVAIAGVGIASQVQQFFGKRMSDQEDERGRKARAQAIADSHRAVEQTFDDREELVVATSRDAAWQILAGILRESLSSAIELRDACRRAEQLVGALHAGATSVEAAPRVSDVLRRAQHRMADTPAALTSIMLGEDWLTNPQSEYGSAEIDPAVEALYDARHDHDKSRLQRAIASAWSTPQVEHVRAWREELEDAAMRDPSILEVARDFSRVSRMKPTLSVLGDYNSGKSSLIRRILVENGQYTDARLDIRAVPATDTAQRHEFTRFDLVDTPGLQSGHADHDAQALEAVVQSALVFVVVHINLLVGDTLMLEQIARGSDDIAAKGGRMVFLVNRCDELGVDPLAASDAYTNLQDRKRDELRAAFSGRSIEIDSDRIHCLSGDPFGLVGSAATAEPQDFAENRLWDGVAALTEAIADLSDSHLASATVAGAFDTAITGLKRHRLRLQRTNDTAAEELRALEPIIAAVQAALDDAAVLGASLREEARRIVDRHASTAKSRIHEIDRDDTKKLEKLVASWFEEPEVQESLEKYLTDAKKRLDRWQSEHSSAIDREIRAADFQLSHEIAEEFQAHGDPLYEDVAEGAGKIVAAAAPLVKAFGNRDAVYAIGKQFGHKFKPWGAVKGGAKVAKVGAVLAVVGAAVDAAVMVNDAIKADEHKDDQAAAAQAVDEFAAKLIDTIVQGDGGAGPLGYLEQRTKELESLCADHTGHARAKRQMMDDGDSRMAMVGVLLASADNLMEAQAREK